MKNKQFFPLLVILFTGLITYLLFIPRAGISVSIFVYLFITIFEILLAAKHKQFKLNYYLLLLLPIFMSSLVFTLRAAYLPRFTNGVLLLTTLIVYVFGRSNPHKVKFNSESDLLTTFWTILNQTHRINLKEAIPETKTETAVARHNIKKVLIGLVIVFPILLIVTLLLSSADPVFAEKFSNFKDFIIPDLSATLILRLSLGFIVSYVGWSYISGYIIKSSDPIAKEIFIRSLEKRSTDIIIPAIITYSLSFVYLLFSIIQFDYLLNAQEFAQKNNLVLSTYAKSGFWQMIFVALINFGLILLLSTRFNLKNITNRIVLLPGYLFILLSNLIMVISSDKRLTVYENGYGFTIDRLTPHIFLIFIVLLIIVFIAAVLTEESFRKRTYILGITTALISFTLFVGYYPMEKLIVRNNVERYLQDHNNEEFDFYYLATKMGIEGKAELLEYINDRSLDPYITDSNYNNGILGLLSEVKREVIATDTKQDFRNWNLYYRLAEYEENQDFLVPTREVYR